MKYQNNILFIIIFFFISSSIQAHFIIPEQPKKIYPVNDYSNLLTDHQIIALNRKLINYKKKKSIAIVLSIIDSLNGEDISMIAARWGARWKIGQKQESNGIFILLVRKDKKISIQIGYGLESYLTDLICKKIINIIIPYLQQEEYYFAIDTIINFLLEKTKNYNIIHNIPIYSNIYKNIFYLFIIMIIIIYIYLKNRFYLITDIMSLNVPKYNNKNQDDNFDEFGEGGEFGGGGASGNW